MNDRITALEKKAAFQEDLLATLNKALVDQQKKIVLLEKKVNSVKEQIEQGELVKKQQEEEPPPHY